MVVPARLLKSQASTCDLLLANDRSKNAYRPLARGKLTLCTTFLHEKCISLSASSPGTYGVGPGLRAVPYGRKRGLTDLKEMPRRAGQRSRQKVYGSAGSELRT